MVGVSPLKAMGSHLRWYVGGQSLKMYPPGVGGGGRGALTL